MFQHIPVCYVADAYGANKKPSIHTRLKEVQLPGILTHQIKLKRHITVRRKRRSIL